MSADTTPVYATTLPHWDGVSKPITYMGPSLIPPGGQQTFDIVDVPVTVADGRAQQGLELGTAGFELVESPTQLPYEVFFAPEGRDRLLTERYYPECCELVRKQTGAARVIAFDHNVRRADGSLFANRGAGGFVTGAAPDGPVLFVHNDYTDKSGPQRVRDLSTAGGSYTVGGALLSAAEAAKVLEGRFAFVNVWRPLNIADDVPLAVCDARSMSESDFVGNALVYPNRVGETHVVRHRSSHRWSFFPRMHPGEALLLKCWDSRRAAGKARFTAHSAFRNPHPAPNCKARESIEVRCLVVFDGPAEGGGVKEDRESASRRSAKL